MNFVQRLLQNAVVPIAVSVYRRAELDYINPTLGLLRKTVHEALEADQTHALFIDGALFVIALAAFVWLCRCLRENWVFQWLAYFLYQIVAFVFFGYGALFSFQTMAFIYLANPDIIEMARVALFS